MTDLYECQCPDRCGTWRTSGEPFKPREHAVNCFGKCCAGKAKK